MSESHISIRAVEQADREWVARMFDKHWGATHIVTRGRAHYGHLLAGFIAERPKSPPASDAAPAQEADADATEDNTPQVEMEKVGLLTYTVDGNTCEIISINSLIEGGGVGTMLVETLRDAAKESNIKRLWLIVTNDNLDALRFWQKHDFVLVAVYPDSIAQARRLKPQIPLMGKDGIPIRDEIELEMQL